MLTRLTPCIIFSRREHLVRVIKINRRYKDREKKEKERENFLVSLLFIVHRREREGDGNGLPLTRQRNIRLRFHGRLQLRHPRDNVIGQRRRYNYDDLSIGIRAIRTTSRARRAGCPDINHRTQKLLQLRERVYLKSL